jgi:proline racemase/trans-L-3-hydroxyproline dehydratase
MNYTPNLRKAEKTFLTVDSHTMGEPTRIILQGFPKLQGETMIERKKFLEKNYDHYRTALMLEPRGHRDMFGALVTEPISEEADLGVIFMDSGGYLNMCGHGSIGTATVAVETGLVEVTEPYTNVVLEAPAGIIRTKVKVENGRAVEVSILNVPAFLFKQDIEVEVEGYGKIPVDISFGGSFFALVDTEKIGIAIEHKNLSVLTDLGMKLLKEINEAIEIKHPYLDITTVDLVEFYGKADNPKADLKNVVIFGEAQADRSPCGTGTSAKLAYLYEKGKIGLGEEFVYESITGSMFRGIATKEIEIDGKKAIIPQITGSAYVTGLNQLILNDYDPQEYGFLMGKKQDKAQPSLRAKIVKAAWNLFYKKGYEAVTLEEIIDSAGVTEDIFNKYFSCKADVLYTLSDLFDERYAELMLEMNQELTCYEKLIYLNKELFLMIEEKVPVDLLAYLYSTQMIANGDRHLLNEERLYYKLVLQIVQEGQARGEFRCDEAAEEIAKVYAMLERGLLYDWCISEGKYSLQKKSSKRMPEFLNIFQKTS